MITGRNLLFFSLVISSALLVSCTSMEPVILHGAISGTVIDAETSDPIQEGLIELSQNDVITDTTITGNDGTFLLKNIVPGDYNVQVKKFAYSESSKNVKVEEAKTTEINISVSGVPKDSISETYLDFGLEVTSLKFVISNVGKKKLSYVINTSKNWIGINPFSGEIEIGKSDTIIVTIDRTGLYDSIIYKEKIDITSTGGPVPLQDTIGIYLNGVMDSRDIRYYKVVKIGTQTWMAENLDVGEKIDIESGGRNNEIIEKLCYHDEEINCEIYGGLYDWEEAMDYNPSDSGTTGTTKGLCPIGYHMPTDKEWKSLIDYLVEGAGGKLKEAGTLHWKSPNTGATNETGFTALPGGFIEGTGEAGIPVLWSYSINSTGTIWSATVPSGASKIFNHWVGNHIELQYNSNHSELRYYPDRYFVCSVRCIKDP
jgi:uncharacterized protein (TIGR02145 family)